MIAYAVRSAVPLNPCVARARKHRYGFEPVQLELFVEYERHNDTCYKAANWGNIGRSMGRGKKSTTHSLKKISGVTRCVKTTPYFCANRKSGLPNIYNTGCCPDQLFAIFHFSPGDQAGPLFPSVVAIRCDRCQRTVRFSIL